MRTAWTTAQGQSGSGQAVALTGDTGYFWFFSSNNVEMVVKVVAGCPLNDRSWVFAGGLTNANVVMTVTDTQTGAVKTYVNPRDRLRPIRNLRLHRRSSTPLSCVSSGARALFRRARRLGAGNHQIAKGAAKRPAIW